MESMLWHVRKVILSPWASYIHTRMTQPVLVLYKVVKCSRSIYHVINPLFILGRQYWGEWQPLGG